MLLHLSYVLSVLFWYEFCSFYFNYHCQDFAQIFPFDWLKTDKLLRIRINAPIAPTVSISPKGLLTSASGSAELALLTPGSDPSHPINVTFSGTTLFGVSMKYNKLRIAIEDFDFEASNSDDAKFDVEEFNGEILYIKEMFMDYITKKSVVLIPVIQEDYIQSAWITVKDKFFRVFLNLSHFWLDGEVEKGENDQAWKQTISFGNFNFCCSNDSNRYLMKIMQ